MGPRVLLVGESNPYSRDPEDALYHLPREASGNRLREILGMSDDEYLDTFLRCNLLTADEQRCTAARAAEIAGERLRWARERGEVSAIVALGRRVSDAFARHVGASPLAPFDRLDLEMGGRTRVISLAHVPHPSGRNLIWNRPGARERARDLIRGLLG